MSNNQLSVAVLESSGCSGYGGGAGGGGAGAEGRGCRLQCCVRSSLRGGGRAFSESLVC